MQRIAVLPSAVADQIAAGEVVERPASVVKELVENALDAGARRITVEATDGGRALVRVSDDGSGMRREDALLALERHATSKIRAAADLVGVASFGFRGEALPAIASVSELTLETAPDDGEGTCIVVVGGTRREVRETARRRGTTVSVARLFYNAPARQAFLRGARSEWRAIVDAMTVVALTRHDVQLTLQHDGRSVAELPLAGSWRTRLAALWGGRYAERLLDVDDVRGATHVFGLVERPGDVGTATRRMFLSVNGRAIRDPGLTRAAETAYRSTLPAGARPSLFLDVVIPAGDVDVNVHPTKAEVRFRDRWTVERALEDAVRRALGTFDAGASLGSASGVGGSWSMPLGTRASVDPAGDGGPVLPAEAPLARVAIAPPDARPGAGAQSEARGAHAEEAQGVSLLPDGDEAAVPALVQLRRTYLVYERADGVVFIDQHSAHERVLYERFVEAFERGEAPAQRLLFPLTLHLGAREAEAYEAHADLFARLGYDVAPFGGHTLAVHAVPAPHPRFDAERCLRETLASLAGDRVAASAPRHERLAATVACKAAIKGGDPLAPEEMRALFVALARTRLPAHDVHGRSTIVHLPWDEVERRFGRA